MVVSYSGIAGKRGYNPTKIVLHNDAGSQNANASYYRNWLESHNPEMGFAHYYVASDGTFQAELDSNKAWHCGNTVGNRDYIGIEICQSNGDEATFRANEQKAFKLAYDLCKKYGIAITVDNFPLHKELSSTSCPLRSFELHGRSNNAVKQYFVDQVAKIGTTTAKNGWEKSGNDWYYYVDGQLAKNGWRNINGKWYLFDAHSKMLTGWQVKDNKWYYFTSNGAMHTGWSMIKGKWYCFDKNGAMVEGWRKSGGKWYYFNADGAMHQGWLQDKSGAWYYLSKPDGEMVTGRKSIDGKEYTFDANGKMK